MIYILGTILIIMIALIVLTIYFVVRMIKKGSIIIRIDTYKQADFLIDEMDEIIKKEL